MKMKRILCTVLLVVGCKPLTPAQEVSVLKASLLIDKTKCAVYILDQKYPRDIEVTEDCEKLQK